MEYILIIYMGKRTPKGTDKHLCISESSSHRPETNTVPESNYSEITMKVPKKEI